MKKTNVIIGLAIFFAVLIAILFYQISVRDEPLHHTVKDRYDFEDKQKLKKEIQNEIKDALK